MSFNIFTTKRVSCFGQYNRIDDLITCKLRREKCTVHRQFLVDEFHYSAVCKCFDPLLVWHSGTSSVRGQCLSQVYVVRWEKLRSGMMKHLESAESPKQIRRKRNEACKHRSIAKVAMGRRMAIELYWMWRNGCDYSQSGKCGSYVGQLGTGHGGK